MNFELKNIEVFDRLSEETIAFDANLFVNGVHIASVSNRGNGESNRIIPLEGKRDDVTKFENWCSMQRPVRFPGFDGEFKSDADVQLTIAVVNFMNQKG